MTSMEYPSSIVAIEDPIMEWEVPMTRSSLSGLGRSMRSSGNLDLIELLRQVGPNLGGPRVDTVKGSDFPNYERTENPAPREPVRILFAFDPGGMRYSWSAATSGEQRWYHENIPVADRRFRRHLESLKQKTRRADPWPSIQGSVREAAGGGARRS